MHRIPALVLALAALLAAAPVASAATIETARRCYQDDTDVVVAGNGFTPLSTISITRDGAPLGSVNADASGHFEGRFRTSELPSGTREQPYLLSASDTINVAMTRYRASKVFADFAPNSGDLESLEVRFSVNGFGLVQRRAPVFLHYVRPNGKLRATIRLGTAKGTCGLIRQTRKRRLFPFPEAEDGRWILQFDTRSKYERATSNRHTPWVRKAVEVFRKR